jgi:hypothetical protein
VTAQKEDTMFIQIAGGDTINFSQVDIINVYSLKNQNIVRMIFPSRMVAELVYQNSDRCLKAVESIMDAFGNGDKQLNLMKNNLQPDEVRYDRVATKL